ncbi:MAG TPA: response regulator transcription factor [Acidobacteria bacterium]|nr:response regulator transcription factor [Acidobacteriota bacterium]
MAPAAIRVLLVDDHGLFREGVRALLAGREEFTVVGEAVDGREAIEAVAELIPDVVLLDIVMPRMSGIDAARWIRDHHPRTEVVILTAHHNEAYQRQAFEAGARGYLLKECCFDDLVVALRHAARGDYFLAGAAGRDMVAEYVSAAIQRQRPGGVMTQRERELAVLLADGYSTKEAAAVLNISAKTAETHRAAIMRKLGARNLADIVKYCIRNHLIQV